MEMKIISKELIKPSLPTPHHLKTHKLSFLDHQFHGISFPTILFYTNNGNTIGIGEKSQLLKQSLSDTLTRYYPFTGQFRSDKRSIDCDDQGAYYVEAEATNCESLTDFLTQPNLPITYLNKFILDEPAPWADNIEDTGGRILRIQVTFFPCGGIVIGMLVSHAVTDGVGFSAFLKDWATTSTTIRTSSLRNLDSPRCLRLESHHDAGIADQKVEASGCPVFDASSLFSPDEDYLTSSGVIMPPILNAGTTTMRRFLFNGSKVATLKARASTSAVPDPTRVEVVSALLWKCLIRVKLPDSEQENEIPQVAIKHAVNIRLKTEPPFPQHYVGNLFLFTVTAPPELREDTNLQGLVFELRKSFKKLTSDVVKKFQGDGGFSEFCNQVSADGEAIDVVIFSSWCNFGIYQLNFGWGKPAWTGVAGLGKEHFVLRDFVVLMDTRSGDGVEAWVNIREEDMAMLQNDPELLAFACKDHCPLQI